MTKPNVQLDNIDIQEPSHQKFIMDQARPVIDPKSLEDVLIDNQCQNLVELIQLNVQTLLTHDEDAIKQAREKELLELAVSCLNYFVQNNWTGPPGMLDPNSHVPLRFTEFLSKIVSESLEVDGENIYELAAYPVCLLIARVVLDSLPEPSERIEHALWSLRCCQIHQKLLRERVPTLKKKAMDLIERIRGYAELAGKSDLHLEFLLEASHLSMFYFEYNQAADLLQEATELVPISAELIGVMGVRTKFQENKVAQLVCRIRRKNPDEKLEEVTNPEFVAPKDVAMNSEVLLERPRCEADPDQPEADAITPLESAFVMTTCLHKRRLQASSVLEEEETMAYVEALLGHRCNWAVLSRALSMRSVMEKKKPKRFERSLLQLEELVNQFKHKEPSALRRLPTLYASHMTPIWLTEKELAHLYISYGSTDTALEMFLKLRLWPEAIECYTHLGRLEKAEAVIRERLALGETPDLYCYLGDVTSDVSYYEKAWTLSEGRSSRSQRAWALVLFYKGKFEESIVHFEKSLDINHLQAELWFTFGCACMALNEISKATAAFRSCVRLEYDNFQAWTNLSACIAKSDDKPRAFRVLEDALKCNYENHRIWENFVVIGVDCGEFEDVIRGYHRLLDLKDKYVDPEILSILVRAVNESLEDCRGVSAARLRPKLQELLGRQTSMVTTDTLVWKLYGQLISHESSTVENKAEKAMQHYQKSQRCLTQKDEYLIDVKLAVDVVKGTEQLLEAHLGLVDSVSNSAQAIQMLASTKLTTINVLTKVKNKHRTLMDELVTDLVEPCAKLESSLTRLIDKITLLNT